MWGVFRTASDHENLRHRVVKLCEFSVDALKIDRSLIREMQADRSTSDIVGRIIELAYKMGMKVIAECIKSPRQVERLLELGCGFGQGYYFSQPMDPKAALQFLRRQVASPVPAEQEQASVAYSDAESRFCLRALRPFAFLAVQDLACKT